MEVASPRVGDAASCRVPVQGKTKGRAEGRRSATGGGVSPEDKEGGAPPERHGGGGKQGRTEAGTPELAGEQVQQARPQGQPEPAIEPQVAKEHPRPRHAFEEHPPIPPAQKRFQFEREDCGTEQAHHSIQQQFLFPVHGQALEGVVFLGSLWVSGSPVASDHLAEGAAGGNGKRACGASAPFA